MSSPNVPGHTIKHCPVIQKSGLRLPKTNSQTNGPSNSVTEPPPPPPTTILRTPENSFERGSISESIHSQVATVEKAMNQSWYGGTSG